MRVLMLTNSYPPVLGGLQQVAHLLAQHCQRRGHAVRVLTQRYPRVLPAAATLDGVSVQRWLFLTPSAQQLRQSRPDLWLAALVHAPLTRLRLAALMRRFQPEVVNVHFPAAQVPFVLWLRRWFPFRLVVSLHGHDVQRWTGSPSEAVERRAWGALLRAADVVTACSQALLDATTSLEPALRQTGRVIYNGVDLESVRGARPYAHPRPYALAYGRLTPKKGFDLLLGALAALAHEAPLPLDLIVAGTGEARAALEAQAAALGLAERVRFLGRASEAEIAGLLAGCRFAVVPSRVEPFGLTVLEALAAGAPLIATRVGGIPEVVAHVFAAERVAAGFGADTPAGVLPVQLVAPTVNGLSAALQMWLRGVPASVRAHAPASEQLERFSVAHMTAAYERAFAGAPA